MPPKKNKKMDLSDFLADDTLGGSWADDDVDLAAVGLSVASTTAAPIGGAPSSGLGSSSGAFRPSGAFDKPERKEFPVPDKPPYMARVLNLPWDVVEEDVSRHVESRIQLPGSVVEVRLPMDPATSKPKGFALVTFAEREQLEEALHLNYSDFDGRRIFVNVAAPPRQSDFDGDWKRGSGGGMGRGGEPEVEIDWGSVRNTTAHLPERERRPRNFDGEDRPPRRQEVDVDWSSRGGSLPEREDRPHADRAERPPRRAEPDLDWGAVRSSTAYVPPRSKRPSFGSDRPERTFERSDRPERSFERTERPVKDEPVLDWGRGATLPPRERSNRERPERTERTERPVKDEPVLDWGRGATLPPREKSNRFKKDTAPGDTWVRGAKPAEKKTQTPKEDKKDEVKPQKSKFSVLNVDDDSEEETAPAPVKELEEATANLSVQTEEDGWEVVRK